MNSLRSADRTALLGVAALLIISAVLAGCGNKGGKETDHSAHEGMEEGMEMPTDKGMQEGMEMPMTGDSTTLAKGLDAALRAPNVFVVANLDTARMERRELPMDFNATGVLAYDPRNIQVVSSRAAGWIDKLYVKYRYQPVQQGQKLMDLYSRELVTEQENYLFLTRQEPKDPTMLAAAGKRLTLLGLTEAQVAELRRTATVPRAITVYSPRAGHLHEEDRTAVNAAPGAMPMTGSAGQELTLREGAYVEKGQTIFSIYGTRTVLALLNPHPADGQDRITIGQKVTVRIEGDTSAIREGTVDLVEPVYRAGASLVSVRVYLPNPGDSLRIGSRISAVIHAAPRSSWVVPATAVISTGMRHYVFAKEAGGFRSHEVITGVRSGEWIELRSGIDPQQAIARNAQLLIDSESFLNSTSP